jgi:hypothetical protein
MRCWLAHWSLVRDQSAGIVASVQPCIRAFNGTCRVTVKTISSTSKAAPVQPSARGKPELIANKTLRRTRANGVRPIAGMTRRKVLSRI